MQGRGGSALPAHLYGESGVTSLLLAFHNDCEARMSRMTACVASLQRPAIPRPSGTDSERLLLRPAPEATPTGSYRWARQGQTLIITRMAFDPCLARGALLPGRWTKIG